MKRKYLILLLILGVVPVILSAQNITLSSSPVPASYIGRGTTNNIVYVVKMEVATAPVTVNTIQFTLTGTNDDNDLSYVTIYFNALTPSVAGSTQAAATGGNWAAPHTYFLPVNRTFAAGESGYFIITVEVAAAATNGNTIKLNGAVNPVLFGYTTAPSSVTNSQTDAAGVQTIQATGITLSSSTLAASNIQQGTNNNPFYILKADAVVDAVSVYGIQFTLTGTHDNNDLGLIRIFVNASGPTLTGATFLGSTTSGFAAPHVYNFGFLNTTIAAGASVYFIVTADVNATATTGNTIKLNGAVNPATFDYSGTTPDITNNQSDAASFQTIGSTLPLTLISFTGNVTNTEQVRLQWITAGELNTKSFDIEWSDDGSHFTSIAIQPAAGNSLPNRNYSYLHTFPADGNNYYRLKMADIDGRFTYSPVVKINSELSTVKIMAYPNPVTDLLQLHIRAIKNETLVFHLVSADGRTVLSGSFTLTKGNNQFNWPLPLLAPGNYFISCDNRSFETIKIVKN